MTQHKGSGISLTSKSYSFILWNLKTALLWNHKIAYPKMMCFFGFHNATSQKEAQPLLWPVGSQNRNTPGMELRKPQHRRSRAEKNRNTPGMELRKPQHRRSMAEKNRNTPGMELRKPQHWRSRAEKNHNTPGMELRKPQHRRSRAEKNRNTEEHGWRKPQHWRIRAGKNRNTWGAWLKKTATLGVGLKSCRSL